MLSRLKIKSAVIAAGLLAGICATHAAAPVGVDGWRYIEDPNELHVYVCDRPDCVPHSRIFYHLDPPNSAPLPGILRKQEAAVSEMLGEQSRQLSPLKVDLSSGQMHSTAMASDGFRYYYAFGIVHGLKWDAWLSSVSLDPGRSQANLEQFEAALKHTAN